LVFTAGKIALMDSVTQHTSPLISVVTPVYGCATALVELYLRLRDTLSQLSEHFEIIFVNDASPDDAWHKIIELASRDVRVKGINLSRNFGQHYAISAGLDHCKGDWVVVMDCDLQDQPEEILKFYRKALEGYDIVFGRRFQRKDTFRKRMTSKFFTLYLQWLSGEKIDNSIGNFSIISRKVAENLTRLKEMNRNYGLFLFWLGFRHTFVDIDHAKRPYGSTSYSFRKLVNHAVNSMVTYSTKPLQISIKLGFFISLSAFLVGLVFLSRYFIYNIAVAGFTTTIVSLFFIGGIIIMNLGLIGLYIGKIFEESKGRPIYIIQEKINF
jgi:dolichol-phosphate mannosyltransferase